MERISLILMGWIRSRRWISLIADCWFGKNAM